MNDHHLPCPLCTRPTSTSICANCAYYLDSEGFPLVSPDSPPEATLEWRRGIPEYVLEELVR